MKQKNDKAIGGYFELLAGSTKFSSLNNNDKSFGFNSGRNAFEAYLLGAGVSKVYLPSYICPVVLEPLKKHKIGYEFYRINRQLESGFLDNFEGNSDALVLWVNYFGIKDDYTKKISKHLPNLIVDNSQAFYSEFPDAVASFNSTPKFFGVPDGGFLNWEGVRTEIDVMNLPEDKSGSRMEHLLLRLEVNPESGYSVYVENEKTWSNQPLKQMSRITHSLLVHTPFEEYRQQRIQNFGVLHNALRDLNELTIKIEGNRGPLSYPFLHPNGKRIKAKLIQERIFIPTYWTDMEDEIPVSIDDLYIRDNLVSLPIDQRYGSKEMERTVEKIFALQ